MYVVTGYHVVYVCPDGLGTAIEVAFVDGAESVDVKEIPAQEVSV
jgi:hypothetical protein